jgi:hypothetical protein
MHPFIGVCSKAKTLAMHDSIRHLVFSAAALIALAVIVAAAHFR